MLEVTRVRIRYSDAALRTLASLPGGKPWADELRLREFIARVREAREASLAVDEEAAK